MNIYLHSCLDQCRRRSDAVDAAFRFSKPVTEDGTCAELQESFTGAA